MFGIVTVDTLFSMCLEKRPDDLRRTCQQGPYAHFLNDMIENNKKTARFTMVYSYLERVNGKPDYDVMYALYEIGADFNCRVVRHESDGSDISIPLLQYAIQEWKNPELAEWLLAHEANPNDRCLRMRGDTVVADQTMLRLAVDPAWYDRTMLTTLLKGGADPNLICDRDTDLGELPPLYFTVAPFPNVEATALLLSAGATSAFQLGKGVAPNMLSKVNNMDFETYCRNIQRTSGYKYCYFDNLQAAIKKCREMENL